MKQRIVIEVEAEGEVEVLCTEVEPICEEEAAEPCEEAKPEAPCETPCTEEEGSAEEAAAPGDETPPIVE